MALRRPPPPSAAFAGLALLAMIFLAAPTRPRAARAPATLAGRWNPAVEAALVNFIHERGRAGARYDPQSPPLAVLSWDHTVAGGDCGLIVFWRFARTASFGFSSPDFWNLLSPDFGRQEIRASYERFSRAPRAAWAFKPSYRRYLKFFLKSYLDLESRTDRRQARLYLARLFSGLDGRMVSREAERILKRAARPPRTLPKAAAFPSDPRFLDIPGGDPIFPEMRQLVAALKASGFAVWVMDDDLQEILEAAARGAGVAQGRVVGIRLLEKSGRITPRRLGFVPTAEGKVAAAIRSLGRAPDLVVGSGPRDQALLSYGRGLRLLIDRGDPALRRLAQKKGWLIQSAFH